MKTTAAEASRPAMLWITLPIHCELIWDIVSKPSFSVFSLAFFSRLNFCFRRKSLP